jgi:amino acid adenylation domain-containing protein
MKNVEDLYPLSPMQSGLLFHSLYDPDAGYYVEQFSCLFDGELDAAAFERAWRQLLGRHAILRTAFVWKGLDKPLQVVRQQVGLPLEVSDWRALGEREREERLEAFLEADRARGFELSEAPLMRLCLVRLADDSYQFVWTSHHLLLDGWSMGLLLRELFIRYDALVRGAEPIVEPVKPYRDYIAWLQRQDSSKAEAYWRRMLAGFAAPTPLGIGRVSLSSSRQEAQYDRRQVALPADLTSGLQTFARRHRLTLGTLMQGAWALLLSRYSAEEDVVFGVTVSGRPADLAEVETMVGLFINTLPMRVKAAPESPLLDWLRGLQEQQAELRQYEFSPLVEVQGWSEVERGQPLFESIFGFENYPIDQTLRELSGGVRVEDVRLAEKTNFPINLAIIPGHSLTLDIMYDCRRFAAESVARLTGHFQTLLQAMLERPAQKLSELPMLTEGERGEMVGHWNETRADYPAHLCLHELFEAQARRTPHAPALAFDDERLSYAELNRRANRLAHRLRSLGVGTEARVGILLERSAEMVVGLLAVLKAGGAYVPLDPTYPRERLASMLDDARPAVLLTQQQLRATLPDHATQVVCVDADREEIEREPEHDPVNLSTPDSLAYVIYTSGSTGRPKGVLIPHRAVVNHNFAIVPAYELRPADRVLQFASLSFDVAVEEIFPTWLAGACVVIRPTAALDSHQAFFDLLKRERITVVNLSTPYWNELMAELARTGSSIAPSLRLAAVGGEKGLPEGFAFAQQQAGAGVRLLNVYGPTETTVTNTLYDATACGVSPEADSVPIGRPIANTQIYLLDRHLQPVPVGVGGEVYIGGDSVARGYLNRPEQTAEKFLPSPFGVEAGARLYKTGDLARFHADGNIEFLGRADLQVKVRGFRIELGEIESLLSQHAGVRETVVLVREDVPGDKRVVAYVVAEDEAALSPGGLRAFVAERLPDYMVPSAFVVLEEMPLTPNGKLDRRALPPPEQFRLGTTGSYAAPRTPVEELVCGIWCEVLGVERVGADEDFFELGGHSLLATQVISRVREALGAEVALRTLFESPTVTEFAASVEVTLRKGQGIQSPPIEAVPRDRSLALSFAQQRLWFMDQLEPGQSHFNMPLAVRLEGKLNVSALTGALNEIVRRHEALRTHFAEVDGRPVQVIAPGVELPLALQDLCASTCDRKELEAEVRRLAAEEAARPFDLGRGPLLRATLLRLSETEHVLLVTMHHIISDGWSLGVLVKEVAALYEAFAEGRPSPLVELDIQYADFAVWQREWLQGDVLEGQLSYWREQLQGAPAVLELPTDRPRPPVQTFRGAHERFELEAGLTDALRALSRREGVTLFMTLLAAWQTLLARYSGQTDVVVGADVANRNRAETEGLIGFFVNMMVLRTDLSGDPTFAELLKRVREVCLGAYAHQDLPFERLVEELQPERSLSHTPLFQVLFVLQNTPLGELELPGVKMSVIDPDIATSKFDLLLTMQESETGLDAEFEYNSDLFDADTIRRMVCHLKTILAGIVADPVQRLSALPLLSATERRRLLRDWNQTRAEYPRDLSVHELFRRQARRAPSAIALRCGADSLTYAELDRRSDALARHLRRLGVGAEVRVALMLERSAGLVVAMLAVLKAGGAYVPLDATLPLGRLTRVAADAGAGVFVTQASLEELLPGGAAQVVLIEEAEEWSGTGDEEARDEEVGGGHLAYVLYTSGSTGEPKGVGVMHRSITRLVCNTNYVSLGADEVFLQFAPVSFDAATFEIWGALLNGAQLVLMTPQSPSLKELGDAIRQYGVTTLWLTAGLFHLMVDEQFEDLKGLRQLLAGGDVLSVPHVERFLRGTSVKLINGYGPTENTTFTCCHVMEGGGDSGNSIPIGRPIANTQVYILDDRMEPSPVGVPGELYTGGDGLARGYLNSAELTAEKFIPDPFSTEPGARLYRTGDVVRYLADGRIEFIGRRDQQVKIRGFRIELGEIEMNLGRCGGVRDAAVIAREDVPGDKRVVAYVVAEDEAALSATDLRRHLQERLPDYMVPSAFVMLEEMPLTPNGKLDRRALPPPEQFRLGATGSYAAPRTPVEELVCGIWCEVLGVERVGADEDFFELGGHSLLATQVISRVREALGAEVALRTLFESPTVKGLARAIAEAGSPARHPEAPPIRPLPREQRPPLSFAQQRLWFIHQLDPLNPFYNMPLAVRLSGTLDTDALARTLDELTRRHEALRTHFAELDGQPVQVVEPVAACRLELVELSDAPSEEVEAAARRLAAEEAARPFDLGRGPLLRATLLQLAETEHVLLVTMHHIISDGWSMGVLVKEVAALYEAFAEGRPSPLAELPIQYADFAVWQREWLQGDALEGQLSYWREQLQGAPAVLELPTDRPRPPVQTFRGAHERFELEAGLTDALRALSRREGVTLFMTLLAAWQTLLARYSGQTDVVVGSPIANRNRRETESLIGFFVNTLVLRTDLSGDPTFKQLLSRVREVTLGAYAHQDLPFERLVEELQPERSLSHTPLFQVLFVLQNAPMGELRLPGLTMNLVEEENAPVEFDLLLNMQETSDGISGTLGYSLALFDEFTARNMLSHFKQLLERIAADSAQTLSDLSLLTETEQRLLSAWNGERDYRAPEVCLHELFEAQAAQTPEAVALIFKDRRVTYRELNGRANRLAHYLKGLGVAPEATVGVYLERSVESVVGLLAVLKSGGVYVPLDIEHPAERVAHMLEDARVSVIITCEALLPRLPEREARVVCLDGHAREIDAHGEGNLARETRAASAAYLIYTSGTTARPKAVVIEHAQAVNVIDAARHEFGFGAEDVMPVLASFTFDISLFELLTPLASGATAMLCSGEQILDLPLLAQMLKECSVLHMVPSLMRQFIEVAGAGSAGQTYERLRRIFVGGDAVPPELLKRMGETFPTARIEVLYGPTEATIFCTHVEIDRSNVEPRLMLGRPLANVGAGIYDRYGKPVPIGVPGEVYLGGAGIARGYLNRPELNAEKFVVVEGRRYYRSGDCGRFLPDGRIEFLGRVDNQVKVRGFRIELGEVETALTEHPSVREAAVVALPDGAGEKRLVAYLVPEAFAPKAEELKQFLQQGLPGYTIPDTFIMLDEMPLTPNGKVDRRALPAPEPSQPEAASEAAAMRTPVEEMLASIWAEILDHKHVTAADNFFDLGGHSLKAMRLVARMRKVFQIDLPLRHLFESPTLAGLASVVEAELRASQGVSAPPIRRASREQPLPLSFAQQRLWFMDQLEPGNSFYNMPLAVRLSGTLDTDALARTLDELTRRHEALRTHFAEVDGRPVQVIAPGVELPLILQDLCASTCDRKELEAEVRRLAAEEAARPFDLGRGPLLRATLLRLSETEHVLLVTMHHIISDGWSLGVLVKEVAALYEAFAEGRPSPLVELDIQYADFAVWQREWLQGDVLEGQLSYWREQLQGAPAVLELPTDKPRLAVLKPQGAHRTFVLPPDLLTELKELAQREGATLFMVLLAAWQSLLSFFSGQEDIVVGTDIANRNRDETEGLIGFFINQLVLRTNLSGDPTFAELLGRVREVTLGAYAHQDLPFEKLVEALNPDRALNHTPVFQVKIVLQNMPMSALELPGLTLESMQDDHTAAKFDLTLGCWETSGGLHVSLEYNADLFTQATIKRMARQLTSLLRHAAAQPETRLGALRELLAEEDEQYRTEKGSELETLGLHKLQQIRRRPVGIPQTEGGAQL